jgi:hypothetical protein
VIEFSYNIHKNLRDCDIIRAEANLGKANVDYAMMDIKTSQDLKHPFSRNHYILGLCYMQLQKFDKAKQQFEYYLQSIEGNKSLRCQEEEKEAKKLIQNCSRAL